MRRIHNYILAAATVLTVLITGACRKENQKVSIPEEERTFYYVNQFAYNMMSTYYLWADDIRKDLENWRTNENPIEKVRQIRYKDASGKDIDKWTMVTDDYEAFNGMVTGNTKSMGFEFALYYANDKANVVAVVTFTYPGGPAEQAGLKRGDTIIAIDGKLMTPDNYASILNGSVYGDGTSVFSFSDKREVTLTARQMQLNPINCYKILDNGGIKTGYLHFTAFTMECCSALVDVFREFKREGIKELVLDLRYNSGGYALTSELLASMIAPEEQVKAGSVFSQDIYNSTLTEAWGTEATRFSTDFSVETEGGTRKISTLGANPCIEKLYVLMTGSTASASESTICGLAPYMPITLVGEQSSGKYCGGIIVDGPTWYGWVKDDLDKDEYANGIKYSSNWGIYVMLSRYADKNGETPCMPDGYRPDKECADDPLDGFQLGDPGETMLSAIFSGKAPARSGRRLHSDFEKMENQPERMPLAIRTDIPCR
ncbi:MAG: PDZ domain-containing protein [Bacteroidales bacterium]|nr:PDZ domain-containing protein [Bacteroidales bacterium]